jgi:peptidoglycan/xylan/chitin deacetylase (PgdA/CDA1 family)
LSDLLVLCYHAVSDTWPSPAALPAAKLEAQLKYLLKRGYEPLALSAALGKTAPGRFLAVTFDDAYASILRSGLPVLERLGVPATVFVPTDAAGEAGRMTWSELGQWAGGEHEDELRCMSWEELRTLSAHGWEIGSHTCSHPHLTELEPERVAGELRRSRAACEEEIQRPCTTLAYPFGSYDAAVIDAVAAAGYSAAVTLDERIVASLHGRGPLEVPREAVYRATGRATFIAKTARPLRRIRFSSAYAALR